MNGINTGILTNAYPLTAEQIMALEERALTTKETFVYLDEQGELCFTGTVDPEYIKDLAWHSVHKLSSESTGLTKNVYKKSGLESFVLKETLQKQTYNEQWTSMISLLDEGLLDDFILE